VTTVILPELAHASEAISDFNSPFEMVVGTITGPVGRWISIAAMGISGITYLLKKESLDGGFKMLLQVVFGICFIAFAASIVDNGFTFSGAII
jgi:type IV secretion system protein VirB2